MAEASGGGSGARRCRLNVLPSCGSASISLSASSGTTLPPGATSLASPAYMSSQINKCLPGQLMYSAPTLEELVTYTCARLSKAGAEQARGSAVHGRGGPGGRVMRAAAAPGACRTSPSSFSSSSVAVSLLTARLTACPATDALVSWLTSMDRPLSCKITAATLLPHTKSYIRGCNLQASDDLFEAVLICPLIQ